MSKEYILCSAIYFNDGNKHIHQPQNIDTGFVVCGRRHHNCFAIAKIMNLRPEKYPIIQGFITSKDRFLNRKDSAIIACDAKQIKDLSKKQPYSEDLY